MTEQLMSVPAISKVPAGSVSGESGAAEAGSTLGETSGAERGGSIVMVLLVAVALVAALSAIMTFGGSNAEQYTIAFLAVLASIGVFSLFAFACGILRVRAAAYRGDPLIKAVVDGAPEAVVVTANDGRVVYANPAYLDLIDASDGKETRPVERAFMGDADASEAIYRLLRAAREGRQLEEEVRVTGMKGRPARWLRFRIRPLGGDKRAAPLTVWSLSDVTRDRERQENVFQELQHAIDYLDHAPAGFFSVNHEGEVVYLNATLANWLDHDLGQVGSGGLKLGEIVAGDGAALLTTLSAAPGEVKTEVLDLDLRTRSGGTVPVRVLHNVAYGADGTPGASRTLVLNRARDDRSDPQRAAEIRFMRFFHHTPMAIATIDKHGGVVRTNPLFARLFHGTSGEAKDRSILTAVAPRDREALEGAIRQAALGKTEIAPVDAMLVGEGERFGRFYVTAVEEEERDQESAIVYALETTAQRELENKVTQQQKMELVGQLAGGIAHDFNNVLSAIMMATDFLLNAHKPTDPSFGDIMQIKQNANRAASLVRHLLAFSRKQTLRPQVLDIGEALSDLTMLLRRLIGEKVALDLVHGRDLWPVKVDISQFEQVIVNLAVNARDAMPNGGKLTVRTSNVTAQESMRFNAKGMPAADYVLVEVTDTGIGIPSNIIGKIFEPFFSTKEVGKGTGLGLSTVYGIIKQTGGFVYVDSIEHKGTVFRIFLPRHVASAQDAERGDVAAAASPAPADRKSPDSVDLTGQGTILLVEDEEGLRQLNARGLASRGYSVLEAGNGIEAIELLEKSEGEVDLVVSDVVMPEMDGPTLLRELRRRNPTLKIIFVSGYAEDAFQKHLPADGEQFTFLAKPFTLKQLVNAVKETLAG